jgi:hypothetical protein
MRKAILARLGVGIFIGFAFARQAGDTKRVRTRTPVVLLSKRRRLQIELTVQSHVRWIIGREIPYTR